MAKMVTLTIDGKPVTVPEATLIVNAARQVGIAIPVFCYHPKMEPAGMCRQCLVEVGRPVIDRTSGQTVLEAGKPKITFNPKLETACTTPVSEGMIVLSKSEKARLAHKDILEFLLTSHPLDCPVCDKGGECPLQNQTMVHGPAESRFLFSEKHHAGKHVPLGDLIWLDRERCIQCARCIRFQDQVAGEPVLAFHQRGRATDIVTVSEPGFDSIFSGNTTDICPVGALTTADFRFGARPWEMKSAASICAHCPVGCNVVIHTRREAKSDGGIAIKRLLPRQNESVNEIWMCDKGRFAHHLNEANDRLEQPLMRINGKLVPAAWKSSLHAAGRELAGAGKNSLILAGGRLSNEDLFNLKQLADSLGGEALLYTPMGGGSLTTSLGVAEGTDLSNLGAGSTILVVASDLYNEAPLWFLRIRQAVRRGAQLILVNARETKLERYAGFVVRYSFGDEVETVAGLKGKPGIGAALGEAENLVVFYGSDGLGLDGSAALAGACAALLQGRAGKANNGLIGVWPRANDQAAWELGFQPVQDLTGKLKGKAVYIAAADPAGDDPQQIPELKAAKSLIVQELFLTETAALAQVVLPAQAWGEREGSFTSAERRAQRFYPAIPPLGGSRADFAITAAIAGELDFQLEGSSAARVMDRIASAEGNYAGLSYLALSQVNEQKPDVGGEDLFFGGTGHKNQQGLGRHLGLGKTFDIPSVVFTSLHPDEDHWLAVPVTQLLDHGITLRPSELLASRTGEAAVRLNPLTAEKIGVSGGDQIAAGGWQAKVMLDDTVPASVVLVPRSMGLPVPAPQAINMRKA